MAFHFDRALGRIFLLLCLAAVTAISAKGQGVMAYYADDQPFGLLRAHAGTIHQLATDTFSVNAKGVVDGVPFSDDLAFARSKGIKTFAVVSNYGNGDFRPAIAHAIISSPDRTQTFIAEMLKKLAASHYSGINLDFESVTAKDRPAFTAFVATLAKAMHDAGYLVFISVPAELQDDPTDDWTGAFDLKALGELVDLVQLMTYDENGSWGDPGPVAGLDWVEKAVSFTASVVDSGKISMGIPAYGYDWNLAQKKANTQIAWRDIAPLLARTRTSAFWDPAASSPHFSYSQNGEKHVVWYEDAKSLGLKFALVAKYHLAGISIWALGMTDDAFWSAIKRKFSP